MANTQYIDIDISGTEQTPFEIVTQQYSSGGRIVFNILDGGKPIDLNSYIVSMWMKKPDDTTIIDTYTVNANTITVTLTYQMTVVSGRVEYNIRLCRFIDPEILESYNANITNGVLDLGYDDTYPELEIIPTLKGTMVVMPSAVTELDVTSKNEWNFIEKVLAFIAAPNNVVKGVKGDANQEYKRGHVELTKADFWLADGRNIHFAEEEPVDGTSSFKEEDIWIKYTEGDDGSYNNAKIYVYKDSEWQILTLDITLNADRVILGDESTVQDAITNLRTTTATATTNIENLQSVVGTGEEPFTADCALVTDGSGKIRTMNDETLGAVDYKSVSQLELGTLHGINTEKTIQEQLDAKVASIFEKDRVMGTTSDEGTLTATSITTAELGILNGIKATNPGQGQSTIPGNATLADKLGQMDGNIATAQSNISSLQTAVNGKQATITGGASTITSSNLTASMALVSNASGKVAASSTITATELGYLNGVSKNIQTQIDGKQNTLSRKQININNVVNIPKGEARVLSANHGISNISNILGYVGFNAGGYGLIPTTVEWDQTAVHFTVYNATTSAITPSSVNVTLLVTS